jgi:hypothetical protein
MLAGMLGGPSGSATLAAADISAEDRGTLPIDQWMGASPVYTHRMRALMGIEGHDVPAIMKALQLDVGFVHGYMNVAYSVRDAGYGEFWLLHCGALMSVEPAGEEAVFHMCHTIEDPTFDATALATNPRARIRPIHRPPRIPADRHPHCHWTIEIDEANEPVGPIPLTDRMRALPIANVVNTVVDVHDGEGRLRDYRGDFEPGFRLRDLTSGALAAVAREFQVQTHLLAASNDAAITARSDRSVGAAAMDEGWLTGAWLVGDRVAQALGLASDPGGVGTALAFTPTFPPGFDRQVDVEGNRVTLTLTPVAGGALDADQPGLSGSLARSATGGVEGTVGALGMDVTDLTVDVDGERARFEVTVSDAPGREPPGLAAFARKGLLATWEFDLADGVRS